MSQTDQISSTISTSGLPSKGVVYSSLAVLVVGLLAAGFAMMVKAGEGLALAIFLGTLTAAVGSVSWWLLLRMTFGQSGSRFVGGVFGGLALRMVLYGAVIAAAAFIDVIHTGALLAVLFASHVAYQILEVAGLHRARGMAASHASSPSVSSAAIVLIAAALLIAVPGSAAAAPADTAPEAQDTTAHGDHGDGDDDHGDGHGDGHKEGEFDLLHHIINDTKIETPFGYIHLPQGWVIGGIDLSPTKHVVWMWIASAFLLIFVMVGKSQVGMVSRGAGNVLEALVSYIGDEISAKNIHTRPERFTPYLCSLFLFILFCNLAGLVPFGATATSNLNVTGGLALLSLILIQVAGIQSNGIIGHAKALCPIPQGIPGWILPLYVPIIITVELVGIVAKPIALTLRLFANMVAGHVVILSLLGLIFILQTIYVAPASVAFALFIYCLEIFVALIQAYIFTMLTALFIGMSQHPAH